MPEVYSDILSTCSPPCGGEAEATCTHTIANWLMKSKSIFYPCRGRVGPKPLLCIILYAFC
jgi:hypothetical protein